MTDLSARLSVYQKEHGLTSKGKLAAILFVSRLAKEQEEIKRAERIMNLKIIKPGDAGKSIQIILMIKQYSILVILCFVQ